jgi:prolyl 4-hydroxylase
MAQTLVGQAEHLLEKGAVASAVSLLEEGSRSGDAAATMLLAVWYLRGDLLSRNCAQARQLLRRAVEIGHVDAALMEIALTANGSGGPPDWSRALSLLKSAAQNDHVAGEHLRLLRAMKLNDAGLPLSDFCHEVLGTSPRVVRFPNFFSHEECAHVAGAGAPLLEPARVIDPRTGRWLAHPIRTSDNAVIGPANEDLVIRALNARIAFASGTRIDHGEPLTILRYRPGQQYRPHLDTIQGAANQRVATMLVYLNEGFGGGETTFPAAALTIKPQIGDGVLFFNTLADGRRDPTSLHAGLPVTRGVKWLATRWIRAAVVNPWAAE